MAVWCPSLGLVFSVFVLLAFLSSPATAFGAGNIASIAQIEGQNWRHGDIEDTLLMILMSRAAGGKRFGKLDVKRVYFGNWLRDYSQAVDVGTVKYVSAEAIRLILWVLGFMSFGYGTKEFEVTADRLGCYRPEEHIDNPKGYPDDARQYDTRLRGPVNEHRELSVNPLTGLKNYIASEGAGITTSAGLVRNLFGRSIHLGRQFARTGNRKDLYEALRLLGTGCHCLEDYSAHSNYTELALIELGERGIFPHVGRQTRINLEGVHHPVYPIVTGTFGGVDFLYSVMGEFSDKATQSEIQELQGTMTQSQNQGQGNFSILQDLLGKLPSGLFGGEDQAGKVDELQMNAQAAQMQNTHITPRQPEEWTRYLEDVSSQIYPILEWHDEIMQTIDETIEKIPVLPQLIEQIQGNSSLPCSFKRANQDPDQINIFVFSLLAPFIMPIINQVKTELSTGSSEVIQSSKEKQLIVFKDDHSTDPTHSMLAKDHFSNILNEPAGKVASQVLKWVVPQLIGCWDDERIDVDRTLNRIINGVLHHPALRSYGDDGAADGRRLMFSVVEQWWREKDEGEREMMRDQLSRDGVEQGRNHKDGVHDTGHGCGKPLGMPGITTAGSSGAVGGKATSNVFGEISSALAGESEFDAGFSGSGRQPSAAGPSAGLGNFAEEAIGGGALGGVLSELVGSAGGGLLGEAFSDSKLSHQNQQYESDGSYTQRISETGYAQPHYGGNQRFGQAEYSQTNFPMGGGRQEFQRFEEDDRYGRTDFDEQVIRESRPIYGGSYEQSTEATYGRQGSEWESEVRRTEQTPFGERAETRVTETYNSNAGDPFRRYGSNVEEERIEDYSGREGEYGERMGYDQAYRVQPEERYVTESRFEDSRPTYERREYDNVAFERDRYDERRRPEFEQEFTEQERPTFDGGTSELETRFGSGNSGRQDDFIERNEERMEGDVGDGREYGREEFEERREYGEYY